MTWSRKRIIVGTIVAVLWALGCGGDGATTEQGAGTEAGGGKAGNAATPGGGETTAPPSDAGAVIQTQETNVGGLVAELTEATREDGVLTVKVRIRNTGTTHVNHNFDTHGGSYPDFYVTAADQKYFLLKDAEGAPLAPVYLDVSLDPGQTSSWWAKFPAPPATETTFDLVMIDVTPFEDVPITDE